MYVNLSHAWFLNYGFYGNRSYEERQRAVRAASVSSAAQQICVLTQEPFRRKVQAADDQYYEESWIRRWFAAQGATGRQTTRWKSPITGSQYQDITLKEAQRDCDGSGHSDRSDASSPDLSRSDPPAASAKPGTQHKKSQLKLAFAARMDGGEGAEMVMIKNRRDRY